MGTIRARASKHGRNKIKCQTYRNQGQQEKNAVLRQERHQRRAAYFAARRASKTV